MAKLKTFDASGVILDVPKTNIFASCSKNMCRNNGGSSAMNKKFGLNDLDEVLKRTHTHHHNEMTVESKVTAHDLNSVIGISAYFINTKFKISKNRLDKISAACQKYHRPLILIN